MKTKASRPDDIMYCVILKRNIQAVVEEGIKARRGSKGIKLYKNISDIKRSKKEEQLILSVQVWNMIEHGYNVHQEKDGTYRCNYIHPDFLAYA